MFKISNTTYDALKALCTRILPAILTFAGICMTTLNYEYTEIVMTIGAAAITCLGTCLGISSNAYYNNEDEEDM